MTFKVDIKHWHAVAHWTWDAGDDVCGICRNHFDGCPPEGRYPGDDSPVVWGTCGHAFHLQCIQKWLSSHTEHKCPMCRRDWEFKQASVRTAEPASATQPAAAVQQQQQQPTAPNTEA